MKFKKLFKSFVTIALSLLLIVVPFTGCGVINKVFGNGKIQVDDYYIDESQHLIIVYSDGEEVDLGELKDSVSNNCTCEYLIKMFNDIELQDSDIDCYASIYRCNACNDILIKYTQHDFKPYAIAPTQTSAGEEGYKCTICENKKDVQIIEPLCNHDIVGDWEIQTEPSCTDNGVKVKKCVRCFEVVESEIIPLLYHVESMDWEIIKEATSESTGLKRTYCTRCDKTIAEEIIPIHKHTILISSINYPQYTDRSTEKNITAQCSHCEEIFVLKELGDLSNELDPNFIFESHGTNDSCIVKISIAKTTFVLPEGAEFDNGTNTYTMENNIVCYTYNDCHRTDAEVEIIGDSIMTKDEVESLGGHLGGDGTWGMIICKYCGKAVKVFIDDTQSN